MSGVQAAVPIHLVCRLMLAGQLTITENTTLPLICHSSSAESLPSGYVSFPDIGFAYKFFETRLSNNHARETCSRDNGQLAVIDSREKVEKIVNNFNFTENAWVGLNMSELPGTSRWITIDGKSTSNLPWAPREPSGNYKCVLLSRGWQGLINQNCPNERKFLCEIALPSN